MPETADTLGQLPLVRLLGRSCDRAISQKLKDPARLQNHQQSGGIKQTGRLPTHRDFPIGWQWFGKLLIQTVREEQFKAKEQGLIHMDRVYNVSLYFLLMERDFAILKVDMVSTWEQWRLNFTARQMALLLYEACDDLSGLLGKDFRKSLAFLDTTKEEFERFNEVCKKLSQFKNANHNFLYNEVRNLVVGHRTQDSLFFLKTVESMNPMKVFKIGGDFYEVIHLLTDFLFRLTLRMGEPTNILKQLLTSPKFSATLGRQ